MDGEARILDRLLPSLHFPQKSAPTRSTRSRRLLDQDTTLVPWKLTRMVAGTQYPWDLTATSYTPLHWRRQIGLTASLITFEHASLEKCPNMLQKAPFERSSNPVSKLLMFCK